ncbi:hypothetical protein X474_16715 [Dethiosulfatarculus sandiegensis]|uniref:Uncharacterized protein n=1 Tax=Dethiosulfatarculus sandiegensis TaxID=1429043 RepID=A0A0D2GDB8_9BACT|nr:hypothetical protein X474_16715 [Dethiosulfatarculus sandiegensis]
MKSCLEKTRFHALPQATAAVIPKHEQQPPNRNNSPNRSAGHGRPAGRKPEKKPGFTPGFFHKPQARTAWGGLNNRPEADTITEKII